MLKLREQQTAASAATADAAAAASLPTSFDWRSTGLVTPVGSQGRGCRSDYAFAAASAIETLWASKTKKLVPISPQAFLDCQKEDGYYGCSGK